MMINKKHILFILSVFVQCVLYAQVQNIPPVRQILATTGGTGIFPLGTMDYTIGECMVTTFNSASPALVKALTQGFQQPTTATDTTGTISPLKFYTGITPNEDGENDTWKIDGITRFSRNTVSLYNRWGDKVWSGKNYDNVTVIWSGKNDSGGLLPDATYFYMVEADGTTYKGWVELTR